MNKIIIILLVFIPHLAFSQLNQTLIQYNQTISKDSLEKTILNLQSYGSRYTFSPNRKAIAEDLKDQLQSYGFKTILDSFYIEDFVFYPVPNTFNSGWQYNVVAEKRGQYAKDTFFVVGAHYDAVAFSTQTSVYETAPGADDNASGVSAIMEIARLYHLHKIVPTKTLRLELYAAEEIGLMGSNIAIERSANKLTEHIIGMLCMDMIGHKFDSLGSDNLKLIEYDNSQDLTNFCEQTAIQYTTIIPNITSVMHEYSDSYPYYQWGRKAIFLHEQDFHPFYHTPQDLSSTLDYNYLSKVAQLAFSITYLATTTNQYFPISIPQNPNISEPEFRLLENPAKDIIRFTYISPRPENPIVQIINRMGVEEMTAKLNIYQTSLQEYQIPTNDLKAGIYFLKIGKETKKIVVIK